MAKKNGFVLAEKILNGGKITPGGVLGSFRKKEFAKIGLRRAVEKRNMSRQSLGIFQEGKLIT